MMHLAYYDESGDDGYPGSSKYFILTSIYFHYSDWNMIFDEMIRFRRYLKTGYGIPVRLEFHTSGFLKKSKPFRSLGLSNEDRMNIITEYCDFLSRLCIRVVNICIDKSRIRSPHYKVLDTAMKFSIQRIENDLNSGGSEGAKFIILTDEGRVGSMRKTARKIRRINYVPSRYGGVSRSLPIKTLIEDPLPKDSGQSFFIQGADLIAYIVYMYCCHRDSISKVIRKRIRSYVSRAVVYAWMDKLLPVLNTAASSVDKYGIKRHPD